MGRDAGGNWEPHQALTEIATQVYSLHGLQISSSWPLPADPGPIDAKLDVHIELAPLSKQLEGATGVGPLVQAGRLQFQLDLPGVARYRCLQGKRLIIDPYAGADPIDVSLFLHHSAMPALMLQRGQLALRACAVRLPGGIALICGPSASGKSSLAAALSLRAGYAPEPVVLGDDVVYLAPKLRQVVLRPGLPWLTLWRDVAATLGIECPAQTCRGKGPETSERFQLALPPVPPGAPPIASLPVKWIVMLDQDNEEGLRVVPLDERSAGHRLKQFICHGRSAVIMQTSGAADILAQTLAEQCQQIVIKSPSKPLTRSGLEELAQAFLRACVEPTSVQPTPAAIVVDDLQPDEAAQEQPLLLESEPDRGNMVWLASYPKSGNTWTRAFLTSYCLPKRDQPLTERIGWISMINARHSFDVQMGVDSADLHGEELLQMRARYHEDLSACASHVTFSKVHDAFIYTAKAGLAGAGQMLSEQPTASGTCHAASGEAVYGPKSTRLAVYIVRNPLDVVVSYANHAACEIPAALATLNSQSLGSRPGGATMCSQQFADRWLGWSENVSSWLDQSEVPVFWMRYEDMLADPIKAFRGLVLAIGLPLDEARLREAVQETSFDKLQAAERDHGFGEKMAGCKTFFYRGLAGRWREVLTEAQAELVINRHQRMMERLGYLESQAARPIPDSPSAKQHGQSQAAQGGESLGQTVDPIRDIPRGKRRQRP